MKFNRMTRRMFLEGAGKMLPMPFLVSLLPKELWAQANSTTVKRYIGLCGNYDYGRHSNWFPSMTRPGQTITSSTGDNTLYYAALNSYLANSTSTLSTVFGNHLNNNINSVNIFRGLDLSTRIAHGNGHVFGNFRRNDGHEANSSQVPDTRTIDQVLRDNLTFNPARKDVAVMGVGSRSWRNTANGIANAGLVGSSPRGVFNYLFNNGNLLESTGAPPVNTAHPRASIMNSVMEDYTRLKNGRQISANDRVALDNALDLLSDISAGLQGTSSPAVGSCQYKSITTSTNSVYYMSEAEMTMYAKLIVAAIMCDVTRVFHWNAWIDENRFDTHPSQDFHQGHSHAPFSTVNGSLNWQYMGDVQRAFVRGFLAPLIDGLAGAIDPLNGQSYLYNSLVHFTLECSQVHGPNYQPCLLAGNAGGSLSSGYLLDYTTTQINSWCADSFSTNASSGQFSNEYVGVPYNRIFNTIFQAMGLSPSAYEDSSANTYFQGRSDNRYGSRNNGISNMGGYGYWGPATSSYGEYMSRQALYNLHHFKSTLPMPSSSAG